MSDEHKSKKKDDETKDDTQEKKLKEQYEFGLNEDVREEIEDEEDSHKEPEDKADATDKVINEDEVDKKKD